MARSPTLLVAAGILVGAASAFAAEDVPADVRTTIEALKARIKDQQRRLDMLEEKVSKDMRAEVAKVAREMADDAGRRSACPSWLDNLKFYGDLRLRYQWDCREDLSATGGRQAKDRQRFRFRLRVGVKKTWLDDQVEVGFRLATGQLDDDLLSARNHLGSDPTSTNQTFDDYFSEKPVWVDRAYAKYEPKCVPGLTVMGGKFGPPMLHTDLVFDSDVNPEGFWGQYAPQFGSVQPFVNVGWFILEDDSSGQDQYDGQLVAYQAGLHWKICKDVKYTVAATYWDWDHYNHHALGNPEWRDQWFETVGLTNVVAWKMFDLPFKAYFDVLRNCDNRRAYEPDFDDQQEGYSFALKVGQNKKKGDWSVLYQYKWLEQMATPAQLTDGDVGANAEAHVVGAAYSITDFLTVGGKLFFRELLAGSEAGEDTVITQVDLVWKF